MADQRQDRTTTYTDKQPDLAHPPESSLAQVPDLKDKFNEKAEPAEPNQAEVQQVQQGQQAQAMKPPAPRPRPPQLGLQQDTVDARMEYKTQKELADAELEKIRKLNDELKAEQKNDLEHDQDHDHDRDR